MLLCFAFWNSSLVTFQKHAEERMGFSFLQRTIPHTSLSPGLPSMEERDLSLLCRTSGLQMKLDVCFVDLTGHEGMCRSLEQTLAVCTNKGLSPSGSHQVSKDIEALFVQVYLPHSSLYQSPTKVKILLLHNMYDALFFARCTPHIQMTSDCGERSWGHSAPGSFLALCPGVTPADVGEPYVILGKSNGLAGCTANTITSALALRPHTFHIWGTLSLKLLWVYVDGRVYFSK